MIFGNAIDDNGVLVRTSTDKPPYFAVGFMSEKANHKFRYVWLYKVRAKPMTETYKTKEGQTITRQTGSVEWTAIKRTSDGRYQAVADEGETALMPPRPPPSSRASMNPRSRRRRTGRKFPYIHMTMMRGRSSFVWTASLPEKKEDTP